MQGNVFRESISVTSLFVLGTLLPRQRVKHGMTVWVGRAFINKLLLILYQSEWFQESYTDFSVCNFINIDSGVISRGFQNKWDLTKKIARVLVLHWCVRQKENCSNEQLWSQLCFTVLVIVLVTSKYVPKEDTGTRWNTTHQPEEWRYLSLEGSCSVQIPSVNITYRDNRCWKRIDDPCLILMGSILWVYKVILPKMLGLCRPGASHISGILHAIWLTGRKQGRYLAYTVQAVVK